jgi:starch phosphorylase
VFDPERNTAGSRASEASTSLPLATRAASGEASVDVAAFRSAVVAKLTYEIGSTPDSASDHDWFMATALAVRDRIVDAWHQAPLTGTPGKKVCYLSLEFLIGRLLSDALCNLRLTDTAREALSDLGVDLDRISQSEPDAALGNGGLGRLAACFMESMATIGVTAIGYGIRYDYGLFRQIFSDGWQQEVPDNWLAGGYPWEFERSRIVHPVRFGGWVERADTGNGTILHTWHADETVLAVAHDIPIAGWRGRLVNALRLWAARAVDPLELETFNNGEHVGAQVAQARAEAISRVLYPSDATPGGQELRLRQEYFFTAASLQNLLSEHLEQHGTLVSLPDHASIQLNDTHPAIAVAELMRLLVDEHAFAWEEAWSITTRTLSYTNHTLMPEALETWPVALMERLLPRHMQIIYLINWLHLERLSEHGQLNDRNASTLSLIDEQNGRRVRMGHLAFLGSHKVNGVSALHTDLLRQTVFREFHELYPGRIVNKTNGIAVRRWLQQANPELTRLLVDAIGPRVLDDIGAAAELELLAGDSAFQARFAAMRHNKKAALARVIAGTLGTTVDPKALFDIQIKRIHEYKRQLLNIFETIALYQAIRMDPDRDWVPRVKIFGGKAAPSYAQAKLIIKLANDVARAVNDDPVVAGRLKLCFLPNYNVSLAEAIIPGADLSEQISTAGMEASGTGNMKFALNGALTIGTLDGANVEIREKVGADNIFIFGMTAEDVGARLRTDLNAELIIRSSDRLSLVLDAVSSGLFSPEDRNRYRSLVEAVTYRDRFMVAADFEAYWAAQREADELWRDPSEWLRKSILNTARMSWFSSDRTIREYAEEIWRVEPAF